MPTPTRNVRRFFGLDTPRVTLTPYLRSAPTQGEAWRSATPSPAASASSPSSAAQTWAPVNTVANQDDLHELVNKIRFLASMGSEDRPLILEVCDRASTDVTAREAIRALMHEFKHGSAAAQLSAARLWAILLRNSSAAFISQSTAADFLEAIEALLASPRTSLVVRHRVLRVLGDAVYSNPQSDAFRTLWLRVKPADELLQGAPYNDHDAILRPAGYVNRTPAAGILDRISPAIPQLQRSDWRFPYAWEAETEVEAPPPSYETATGTMLSQTTTGTFGTESAAGTFITESAFATLSTRRESHFYESPDHTVLLNISARRTQDEESDSDSDSVENRESDSSPFRTPVLQISPPPAGPRVNLDLDLSPLRPSATRDWSSLAPNSATATQVTSRPTAIRRLPLVQADNRSNAVASSSRPAAVSPPQNAAPRKKGIYLRTLGYLRSVASTSDNSGARTSLDCFQQAMGSLTTVSCLVYALQYRDTLAQISEDLGVAEHPKLKAALAADQAAVADTLLDVLYSPGDEQAVLALEGDAAQSLLDIVQDTLDSALLHTSEATSKARRLIGKLAKKCDRLPSSLIIFGVTQRDEHPTFCGGFGDVFKAMYQGRPVALKHMRMFQSTDQRDMRRKFCREALVWQRLRHLYIVPLIGIDTESFPSSLCMVSPWMKNGTVIKYLSGIGKSNRQATVNRLIREIAQGLAFLHEQNVVHGDLRGSNILVDDDGHACLTDFGLTVLSDATATQTPNGAGSVPWMAPEMLNPTAFGLLNPARTPASDIYAFGCVCLELFTGYPPFHEAILFDASLILKVIEGVRPIRPAGDLISDKVWSIMQKCWAHIFADRPTIPDIVLELAMHEHRPEPPVRSHAADNSLIIADEDDSSSIFSDSEEKYEGWVTSVISPLKDFIDMRVNPRHHYLDLQEIADGPGGTTIYVARLADPQRDHLTLPAHVKERDAHDLLAQRPTFVAIKSVPIMPSGSSKLVEMLRELLIMNEIRCENILEMDALYVDPLEDTLWIRMELMTRTLGSVIELNAAGLALSDRVIAGCIKDILTALEHLRVNGIAPRNIRAKNVLINNHGVLKLTNLSKAVRPSNRFRAVNGDLPPPWSTQIASDASALGALVWEMAAGKRPPLDARKGLDDWPPLSSIASRTPAFHEFIRMCFEPEVCRIGYRRLLESAFIAEACERPTLAQLLVQCTAFEGRLREQQRAR